MYLNKKCPFYRKINNIPMKKPFHCSEPSCRFQVEGVCVIIGAFYEARLVNIRLAKIEEKLGIKKG